MPQYLLAIHHARGYEPTMEDEAMHRDIDAVNDEMVAAGVRVFVGGLEPIEKAKSVKKLGAMVTDGPFLETKEYVGGFWILQLNNMDEAMEWARKASAACRAPAEVRAFHEMPTE